MTEPIDPNDGALVEVPRAPVAVPRKKSAFKLFSMAELLNQRPPPWLVKRVLRCTEHGVLFSEPGVGKTFIALDLGLKIVSGKDWWGYGVKPGPVVYLAAEGTGGLRQRARAWALENNVDLDELPFYVLPHAVIFGEEEQFAKFIAAIEELTEKPVLIVIDTLARCMAGCDENSAEEVGTFIDRCGQLQAFGAAVLVIHHKNKAGTAERGSTALRGAADVMWDAVRHEEGTIKLFGSKAKDTELLRPLYLKTKLYTLGIDADGELESSLALQMGERPAQPDAGSSPATPRSANAAGAEFNEDTINFEDVGFEIRGTMATLYNGGPVAGAKLLESSGVKRTVFYDVLKAEIAAGRIGKDSESRYPKYLLTELAPEYVKAPLPEAAAGGTSPSGNPASNESGNSSPSPSPGPVLRKLANSDSDSRSESPTEPAAPREFESEFPDTAKKPAPDPDSDAHRDDAPSRESESESGAFPKGLPANSDSRLPPQPDPAPKASRPKAKKKAKAPESGPAADGAASPATTFESDPPRGPAAPADGRSQEADRG